MYLPALKELQSAWEKKKCDAPKYVVYKDALTNGLAKQLGSIDGHINWGQMSFTIVADTKTST